jgi:2-(1,2-epoxy-1,2-dihydrophenyl)acetyl-CoA isomerase
MTAPASAKLLTHAENGVGTIAFNRPQQLNALDLDVAEQFCATLGAWREDPAVRAIVIRGAGRVFSAGGDVQAMEEAIAPGADRAAYFRGPLATVNRMVLDVRALPKPVVAVVHGAVAGVAFNLMLACDLRLVAEGTRFTQAFVKLGLSPDGGGTFFLPRHLGHARACELAMLPTEIDAARALAWGLVNWVVPAEALEEKLAEVVGLLVRGPATALARTKALFNRAEAGLLGEQLEAERLAQVENAATSDFAEGVAAFLEKRQPRFAGPPG